LSAGDGRKVTIEIDEIDDLPHEVSVFDSNRQKIGGLDFREREGPGGRPVLKLTWAFLTWQPGYTCQGIGRYCLQLVRDRYDLPIRPDARATWSWLGQTPANDAGPRVSHRQCRKEQRETDYNATHLSTLPICCANQDVQAIGNSNYELDIGRRERERSFENTTGNMDLAALPPANSET
jgi:hypothetical protein